MNYFLGNLAFQKEVLIAGDLISTSGDCKGGRTLIQQMNSYYKQAAVQLLKESQEKLDEFNRQFGAVSASINESHRAVEEQWTVDLPFSGDCGQIKAIGLQAQEVTKQMATFMNAEAPKTVEDKGLIDNVLPSSNKVLLGIGLIAAALIVPKLLEGKR